MKQPLFAGNKDNAQMIKKFRSFRFVALFALVSLSALTVPPLANAAAISVTAGSVQPSISAVYLPGDHYAKAAITAGQAVYFDTSITAGSQSPTAPDIGLASASGAGDAAKPVGIAANGAGIGQKVNVVIRDPSFTLGGTIAAGSVLYVHTTAGAVTSTYGDLGSGNFVCVLGIGIGSNKVNIGATTFTGLGFLGLMRADVAIP